jgi:UDP-N-acetylglucosamine 4,6-dehydratase
VAQVCIEAGVKKAIFISSDKAAAPLNLYGATKACAEKLWLAANSYSGTGGPQFSAVRYGNVAGSTGSVIPLWRAKIAAGEPVPVTDPKATRFWFTAEGAVDLVLSTLETMQGWELVVPKLPSFSVGDLAEAMGGTPVIVGPREGDKAHEDMIAEEEGPRFWYENGVFVAGPANPPGTLTKPWCYRSGRQDMLSVNELRALLLEVA